MKYLLLIHADESTDEALSEAEMGEIVGEYVKIAEELEADGRLLASERLRPVSTATTLRERDGEFLVTDGPFAETKEQLGGFYLIDVEDLDAAIAVARRFPSVRYGSVEVRPVWEMTGEGGG